MSKTIERHLPAAEQESFKLAISEQEEALHSAKTVAAISLKKLNTLSADIRFLASEIAEGYEERAVDAGQKSGIETSTSIPIGYEVPQPVSYAYAALAAGNGQCKVGTIAPPYFNGKP